MINFPVTPNYALTGREFSWILFSYCLGCFTAGYYWTRWRTGQDIRALGSGNVGARNVGRNLGVSGFTVTLLLDVAKGAGVIWGAQWLGVRPEAMVAALVAVVVGHNWPLQLRFHGGKGIAVSVGALLVYEPFILLCLVSVFLPLFVVTRLFTLSGMLAYALGPLLVFLCGLDKAKVAAISFVAILVVFAHRRNIREDIARMVGARPVKGSPASMHKGSNEEA
jgi:glycerol-3-phosphate acyltransferase PlsY